MPLISIIVALNKKDRAIGKDNKLLWKIPEDLKRFQKITSGHPVIMGRKTWESIPEKFRPLPDRTNIVITKQENYSAPGAMVVKSLEEGLKKARTIDQREIFIIGGQQIYEQAISETDRLYLTLVDSEQKGDVYFPEYEKEFLKKIFSEKGENSGLKYEWVILERV